MDKLKIGDHVIVINPAAAGTTKYGTVPSPVVGIIGSYMYVVTHVFRGVGDVQSSYRRDELLLVTRENNPELFI